MPQVLQSRDFRIKMGQHIESITKGNEAYIYVANGTDSAKSFVVVNPLFFGELLGRAGFKTMQTTVLTLLEDTKEVVSEKYRRIRSQR